MKFKRLFISTFIIPILVPFVNSDALPPKGRVPSYAPAGSEKRSAASPAARGLNVYQTMRVRNYLSGFVAAVDSLRILAVQIQFSDSLMGGQPGSRRPELRDSLYFADELKHLVQYFDGASRKRLAVRWEIAPGLHTLAKPMGYYGDDIEQDTRVVEMMQSVIEKIDDAADFSRFDTVVLIHAGAGQETDIAGDSEAQLWSTFLDREDIDAAFADSTVFGLATNDSLGGEPFFVDNFLVLPSNASQDGIIVGTLGIWAFEVGSRLGLLPLFDSTPEGFPDSRGAGSYCLMSHGLFNGPFIVSRGLNLPGFVPGFPCALNRLLAGWVDPIVIEGNADVRLHDINRPAAGDTACIKIPISESEYFLVVNRVHDTNFDSVFTFFDLDSNLVPDNTDSLAGAEFDFFLTFFTNPFVIRPDPNYGGVLRSFVDAGSGVYVWHVDENVIRQALDAGFLPNDFAGRKGVDLEEADGVQDLDGVEGVFSFGSYFDSFRKGHNAVFGPDSDPGSAANSGARTGVLIKNISSRGEFMSCRVERVLPYTEVRRRWEGTARFQPPTSFDADGSGAKEIVVLADTGRVYVFDANGNEFLDRDGDPSTVAPYVSAPGAVWVGPPAFGDLDGGGDEEIVAGSEDGSVYAWRGDGTEVTDGDGNPLTQGVLFKGMPLAAPPVLVDVSGDAREEIAVVERLSDTLRVGFVNGLGGRVLPDEAAFQTLWPAVFQAQYAAPLAYGACGDAANDTEGLVIAWADTLRAILGLTYLPTRFRTSRSPMPVGPAAAGTQWGAGAASLAGESWTVTVRPKWTDGPGSPPVSPVAVGDLDGDGFDEAVLTIPDGRLLIYRRNAAGLRGAEALTVVDLLAPPPSSPALGDIDGNGTLEIALWDAANFYLYDHSGRLYTDWPKPIAPVRRRGVFPLAFDSSMNSPLVADVNGNGTVEVLYPTPEGTFYGFDARGRSARSFPRVSTSGVSATPTIDDLAGSGELSLVSLGVVPSLAAIDAVSDTIVSKDLMVLSIQTLPGSSVQGDRFWTMYQHDGRRRGRVTEMKPLVKKTAVVERGTFIVYPNPVKGNTLRARVILNRSATVRVEIYNMEGERAVTREFLANPGDVVQTPFDEPIDVGGLKSGVYLLRLSVTGPSGSATHVKSFAVVR